MEEDISSALDVAEQELEEKTVDSFDWLSRGSRGPTYVSYTQFRHLSAWAFEFGAGGYAGCCNYGGELLHLSAASERKGLIFAHGNFSNSLYASLARAQAEIGGTSTFGLEMWRNYTPFVTKDGSKDIDGSSFRVGQMLERGCFNYRWPLNEYTLLLNDDKDDTEAGTCSMFSFIKDSVCYQVLRIEQVAKDLRGPLPEAQVALKIGGPILLQTLRTIGQQHEASNGPGLTDRSDWSPDKACLQMFDQKIGVGLEARVWQLDTTPDDKPILLPLSKQPSAEPEDALGMMEFSGIPPYRAFGKLEFTHSGRRTATFVATIRLFEEQGKNLRNTRWPPTPTSRDLYEDAGVRPSSILATSVMWDSIIRGRGLYADSISEPTEVCLVARCLEKILQVDAVPAMIYLDERSEAKDERPLAFVSNLFTIPSVDLRSLFWKVRFLAKVHRFLLQLALSTNLSTDSAQLESNVKDMTNISNYHESWQRRRVQFMAEAQLRRIEDAVENLLLFLCERLMSTDGCSSSFTPLMGDQNLKDDSDNYYIMMTIWFAVRNISHINFEFTSGLAYFSTESPIVPADNHDFHVPCKEKIPLLQWYHCASILGLFRAGYLPKVLRTDGLEMKMYRLRKAAQTALAARTQSNSPYSAEDEIVDRLAFLAHELGLEEEPTALGTIGSQSIQRIKQREYSRYLNPGMIAPHEKGYICGPWEIHALCHNSRLHVLALEDHVEDWNSTQRAEDIESFKAKIYKFLNSEATLVSCWERSHLRARKGWLRSEATAVVGSTLLDILEGTAKATSQPLSGRRSKKEAAMEKAQLLQRKAVEEAMHARHLAGRQVEVLETLTSTGPRPIDWTTFATPHQYHPNNFIHSLDDTPHLYRAPVTNKMVIPEIIGRVTDPPGIDGFSMDDVRRALEDDPGSVSISDIVAISMGSHDDLVVRPDQYIAGCLKHTYYDLANAPKCLKEKRRKKQTMSSKYKGLFADKAELIKAICDSLVDQVVQHRILTIRRTTQDLIQLLVYVIHPESATCLSNHVLHIPEFSCQSGSTWVARVTLRSWKSVLVEPQPTRVGCEFDEPNDPEPSYIHARQRTPTRSSPRTGAQERVSRVSVGINARDSRRALLGTEQTSVSLAATDPNQSDTAQGGRMFGTYLPESEKCPVSRTPVTPRMPSDLSGSSKGDALPGASDEDIHSTTDSVARSTFDPGSSPEDEDIGLPEKIGARTLRNPDGKNMRFELTVSSIILSTNAFGEFSKCTIISETVDENDLIRLAKDSRQLWLKFVHQPQTARCLVFLLALGMVCCNLAKEYKLAGQHFADFVDFETVFLDEQERWQRDHTSIAQFKLGLWSLDSMYKLQGSLDASVHAILQAKQELLQQANDGSENRSEPLQRMYHEYVMAFDSNLVKLTTVKANLESTIALHSRYKDALSAVLALRDSRASLSQNSTIEKLTYLTIGYLPMAFMAAVFAIPKQQQVVFEPMGRAWFIGGIIIMSLATWAFASMIGQIIDSFRDLRKKARRWLGGGSNGPSSRTTPVEEEDEEDGAMTLEASGNQNRRRKAFVSPA